MSPLGGAAGGFTWKLAAIGPTNEPTRLWASGPGPLTVFISLGRLAEGIMPRPTKIIPCCMALMTNPSRVLSLSPENDDELVNAPATLSFQASVNHFLAAVSRKAFIPA